MAWDFSTEPEFQAHLDWMAQFVREEIWPLETLDLTRRSSSRVAPLQEQVRVRGLWAAHLSPELGGQGFGQIKLGLMHEILGTSPYAPSAFGNQAPDSGNSELIALAGTREQRSAGSIRCWRATCAGVLHDRAGSAGADPTLLQTRAVLDERRGSGSSTGQVVLDERVGRGTSSSSWRSPTPTPSRTSARR